MSQFQPGKFASQQEKDCAAKTGYRFIEPMLGEQLNPQSVLNSYNDCILKSKGTGDPKKSVFNTKNIVIGSVLVVSIFVILKISKII